MTLNEFFIRHGSSGFEKLAEKAGTKVSYLQQLNYLPEKKRPSMAMAQKLVDASVELNRDDPAMSVLTFDGLANPKKVLVREARAA